MKSKKYLLVILLLADTFASWAQAVQAAPAAPDATAQQFPDIMTMTLVAAGALLFIVAMIYVIKVNQFLYSRLLKLEAQTSGATLPEEAALSCVDKPDTFWANLRTKY